PRGGPPLPANRCESRVEPTLRRTHVLAGKYLRESSTFRRGLTGAFIRNQDGHGLATVRHHHALTPADACHVTREPIAKAPDPDGPFHPSSFVVTTMWPC